MLTKTIGQLSAAASITSADKLEIEQSGASKYCTFADITTAITSTLAVTPSFRVPRGYISGLLMTNDTDTEHDISFGIGECSDSTGAYILQNTGAIVKQIDATWAAGTAAGGMFTGTVATAITYHCFAIRKDSDGTLDFGFDTSSTATNRPSGYTYYRRVGSIRADASANIINFVSREMPNGVNIVYLAIGRDSFGDISTTSVLITLPVPSGFTFLANLGFEMDGGDSGSIALTCPDTTDFSLGANIYFTITGVEGRVSTQHTWTNTSAQVRIRGSAAGQTYNLYTLGFIDPRTI